MGIKCGIVGLPNVGKSTLFNALTRAQIPAENYPFCTIDPNVGVVPLPDPRLQALAGIANPERILPTTVEFVDIAGIVKGAAKGEGLGNKFLAHIREVDAITHVVRCFEDGDVIHVAGAVNPLADIETINTELALADLDTAEKGLTRAEKAAKAQDKEAIRARDVIRKVRDGLNSGTPARALPASRRTINESRARILMEASPWALRRDGISDAEPLLRQAIHTALLVEQKDIAIQQLSIRAVLAKGECIILPPHGRSRNDQALRVELKHGVTEHGFIVDDGLEPAGEESPDRGLGTGEALGADAASVQDLMASSAA